MQNLIKERYPRSENSVVRVDQFTDYVRKVVGKSPTDDNYFTVEMYCKNLNCSARNITFSLKMFEEKFHEKRFVCPVCRERLLKLKHFVDYAILLNNGTEWGGELVK